MKPRNMVGEPRRQFVPPGKANGCGSNKADNYESDGMVIKNLPFLSFLNPQRDLECLYKPFKSPCENLRTQESDRLLTVKTLGVRRRWGTVPTGMIKVLPAVDVVLDYPPEEPLAEEKPEETKKTEEPPAEPLVLWTDDVDGKTIEVVVPPLIGKFLRPHQREGVQFLFDCVTGIRGFAGTGCILADDMGLGKTLQSITILYTLLCTSIENPDLPTIHRAIVVCPTSLVKNWDDEIVKWLKGTVKTVALYESGRENVLSGIMNFINGSKYGNKSMGPKVLIISYETFRTHAEKFAQEPQACELLICDEAHRLKNSQSQINQALAGTPMQNDLEEFYAMVDFTNPDILGDPREFRRRFLGPILVGREPDCSDHDRKLAQRCSSEMCEIVNQFILRRTNSLNAKFLPPKLTQCTYQSKGIAKGPATLSVLDRLMQTMRRKTDDRIVIVSNYTQTLDVVSALCRERNLPAVRLDGSTSAKKRKNLVDTFNDPKTNSFAFLLSSKAGGCGLNLIGANRLVLFDPDWNPATDKQAAARIWREGQKKQCFIYRFVATGTLEEKIFQRQLSKEGLQSIVDDKEERLFVFMEETPSDTHDQLKCSRCQTGEEAMDVTQFVQPQIGMPAEEDLNNWSHHYSYTTVEDEIMKEAQADQSLVSFIFSCRVDWDLFQERAEKERLEQLAIDKENVLRGRQSNFDSDQESDTEIEPETSKSKIVKRPRNDPKRTKKQNFVVHSNEESLGDVGESESEGDFSEEEEPVPKKSKPKHEDYFDSEEEVLIEPPPEPKPSKAQYSESESDEAEVHFVEPQANEAAMSMLEFHSMGGFSTPEEETKEEVIWSCSRCTLHNPMEVDSCEGCGMPQPRKAKKVSPSIYVE
ncbi:unnamed protein product [Aphanomyces euteiches]